MSTNMLAGSAILKLANRYSLDDSGATAIEYAFIAMGIALAIAGAVVLLGGGLVPIYQQMAAIF